MTVLNLNIIPVGELQPYLNRHNVIVACLCAAWCDVCTRYRTQFELFAVQHPELLLLWIDVEDNAELVGDFNVDNFPTILIQQYEVVTYYGTMQPDTNQLSRLLQSQKHKTKEQLTIQASLNAQQQLWQREVNLLQRLRQQS
ncbi:MAG: thioredoxin [Solimicrobium sp.]|jgi:thioredoxin-like negative regulator of GroEL|nr:thioredoxin [Solimicrobium sp.]